MNLYDKTGRKMEDGDLFRMLHFIDGKTRRKRYLYFLLQYNPQFNTKWCGVDIRGGFDKHRWPLYECDAKNLEIVNSPAVKSLDGGFGDFVDRPINRAVLEQRKQEKCKMNAGELADRLEARWADSNSTEEDEIILKSLRFIARVERMMRDPMFMLKNSVAHGRVDILTSYGWVHEKDIYTAARKAVEKLEGK